MNSRMACLLISSSLWLIGCRDDSSTQPSIAPTSSPPAPKAVDDDEIASQEFGEFSFAIPKGWTIATPDRNKTKVMILLGGRTWQDSEAMIKVDVGTPAAPTARQLAEEFADSAGGTVAAESLDFDGTSAVNASTPSTNLTTPKNMIIMYRDGKAYLLMAGAVEGVDLSKALSHIRESWKWTKQ